ncbi:MAG TPA: glycosyltransferase family 4 protein [Burkholderiales bacterium]|nr:glycosyltransferase family 4 protein [Burkholderiales bacterium]
MKRLLYVVTEDWYFCSHRLPLAIAARQAGYEVGVATRVSSHGDRIVAAGIRLYPLNIVRRSHNVLQEARTILDLCRLYRAVRPDIVHHVAIKPVLYGSLAARLVGVPKVVNAIAGLGYVFSSQDARARLLRPAVEIAYRILLEGSGRRVILQNEDDVELLTRRGVVCPQQVALIRGSGVDLMHFAPADEPAGIPLVVLPARMLKDKGVFEFVEAARMLKSQGITARFALVGDTDPENPSAVEGEQLKRWQDEGIVEWWGWQDDMNRVFQQSAIVCLPSWREGLPKALIEAASVGRPLIACDVPGCREVVRHDDNGLLVPVRNPESLACAIAALLKDARARARMGARSRQRAVEEFSIDGVIERTLELYDASVTGT